MGGSSLDRAALLLGAVVVGLVLTALGMGAGSVGVDWRALAAPAVNSLWMVAATVIFEGAVAFPAALWLHGRKGGLTRGLEILADGMAGVPSVVVGLFGLAVFVQAFGLGFSLLTGALTLGLLNLPYAIRLSTAALVAADDGLLEAALALGASPEEALWRLVLPHLGGRLLAPAFQVAGRAMGEAAALYLTSGVTDFGTGLDPLAGGATLSLRLFYLLVQGGRDLRGLTAATAFSMIAMGVLLEVAASVFRQGERGDRRRTRSK